MRVSKTVRFLELPNFGNTQQLARKLRREGGRNRGGSRNNEQLCRISASRERWHSPGLIRPIGAERSKPAEARSGRDADVVVFPAPPRALMRFSYKRRRPETDDRRPRCY